MSERELHALALPTGPQLRDAVTAAIEGPGPAILPLDPTAPPAVTEAILRAMRPHAILTVSGLDRLPDAAPIGESTALVIATSGSTGSAKGVELSAVALRHSASATLQRLNARAGDRWLCCLPTSHIAGLQVLTRSVVAGTWPVLHERFDINAFARADAEFAAVVPTMLIRLLDAGVDLSRWKAILLGGAAAPPALLERARDAGARIHTTYGMSETCGGCVYNGRPLDGVQVRVRRRDGRIVLSGPVLTQGYRLDPALTAESLVDGELITGDLGRTGPDGALHVLGRADDAILTGGLTVAPAEVAAALAGHPAVAEVAVTGADDPEWGQRVVALVVARDTQRPPEMAELRDWVAGHLRREAAPRGLVLLDAIPLLPSGKPDGAALRRLAASAGPAAPAGADHAG